MTSKSLIKWNPETASLFWTILMLLFLRAFVAEPYKIPTGSMIPTLLVGDHIFVSKSTYDIRIPFSNIPVFQVRDPVRGDVVVFDYPNYEQNEDNAGKFYIKRLLGVPGDRIRIKGGIPVYNDNILPQKMPFEDQVKSMPGFVPFEGNQLYLEQVPGMSVEHWVQRYPYTYRNLDNAKQELMAFTGRDCIEVGVAIMNPTKRMSPTRLNEICEFTVPDGKYFFMGDNRDDSADSREWGFVDRERLKGQALFTWMSFPLDQVPSPNSIFGYPVYVVKLLFHIVTNIRWSRIGHPII